MGMGASNVRWMQEQLGIPFRKPLGRLKESVEVLRAAFAGDHVTYEGEAFEVNAELAFSPPRKRPPIFLGVKGRRALRLARELADGVLLSVLSSPAYVEWARERVGPNVELGAYVAFSCHEDPQAARDALRPTVATFLGVHGDHDITRVAGLEQDVSEAFRAAWRDGRSAAELVSDDILFTFAVAGSERECAEGFTRLRKAGLDTLVVRDDGETDPRDILEAARRAYDFTR